MLNEYLPWFGIAMLVCVSIVNLKSGLAIWEALIAGSTVFAGLGVGFDLFGVNLLALLSHRLLGLLESDLFQAIPLYVFMGTILKKTDIAKDMLYVMQTLCEKLRMPKENALLFFSLLVAPMNGSVASTAHLLNFRNDHPTLEDGVKSRFGLIASASTIGMIIPPSLVLLMMGDAMMRAHTEAMNLGLSNPAGTTILNTKDIFLASLFPGFLVFFAWVLINGVLYRRNRHSHRNANATDPPHSWHRGAIAIAVIVSLFIGVFQGFILAVEAAATGCLLLCLYFFFSNSVQSKSSVWHEVVKEAFALSGSLLTILFAATAFSMVFRLFETDRLIHQWILSSTQSLLHLPLIFFSVGLCALMMDAFELILVIIPIVSPGLILLMGDAKQVAILLLLTLQISFLLPPFGYAILMARNFSPSLTVKQQIKLVLPYIVAILAIFILFLWLP